jgi:hypothetical protein
MEEFGGGAERAAGVDHVVDEHAGPAAHLPDECLRLDDVHRPGDVALRVSIVPSRQDRARSS